MTKRKSINITPDKSLIKKLGLTGYRTEQAIAELIDNSIDARIPEKTEHIDVRLDFDKKQILVTDNGIGMGLEDLQNALTIAKETKKEGEKLGQFGLGMKSACSNLGKAFTLITTKQDSNLEYTAKYDEEQWLNDRSKNWTNFEIEESEKDNKWHGTIIIISKLKIPLYPNQISNFKKRFGIRYGPYLKNGQIQITINSRQCKPIQPELEEGTKRKISIKLPSGNIIKGWVGLLEKRSIKGDYGIHLIRKGRLIKAFDKFGIRQHPEVAKIVGELSLDHVPVNFHKTGFFEDSLEYQEAEKCFRTDPVVIKTLRSSSSQKTSTSEIQSILNYKSGTVPETPIDTRISISNATSLLHKAEHFTVEDDNKIEYVFEDGDFGIYLIETRGTQHKVTINRNSDAFKSFKNPLFLLGLIKIEVELYLKTNQKNSKFLEERNILWTEFVSNFLPKTEIHKSKRTEKIVPLPNYSLVSEMIELHDHIKENFEHSFQFTGLSTLSPFLQNAYNKIFYNIQTVNGAGQELLELINEHSPQITVLLDPKDTELDTIQKIPVEKIIIIREYAEKLSTTWAIPEKAWFDLYYEVIKHGLTLYKDELIIILDDLLENSLLDKSKLRSLARHRKIQDEIEEYIGSE